MTVPVFEAQNSSVVSGNSFTSPSIQQTAPALTVQAPAPRFTDEDIERARQEEKAKLYPRLDQMAQQSEALQKKLEELEAEAKARKDAEEATRKEAEAAAQKAAEAEMDALTLLQKREQEFNERLQQTQSEWESKFNRYAEERAAEHAMLEKERELASLAAFTQQRLAEERDNIAPQLLDFISGNSQEEIETSIERAKAKSAELVAAMQEQVVQTRAQQRGVSPTGYAAVGPLDVEGQQRQYSAQDIQNMSVQEYAKFRQQVGIGGSGQGRGLFG